MQGLFSNLNSEGKLKTVTIDLEHHDNRLSRIAAELLEIVKQQEEKPLLEFIVLRVVKLVFNDFILRKGSSRPTVRQWYAEFHQRTCAVLATVDYTEDETEYLLRTNVFLDYVRPLITD